jgi:hypothetical protein
VDYRNNPPMNVMCHERHIYSLNDNLESLAQTLASGGDQEAAEEVAVRVGTDYRLKKDGEVGRKHKMIKDVDDIFNIMKAIRPREWRAEPGRHLDDPGAGRPGEDTVSDAGAWAHAAGEVPEERKAVHDC